MVAATGAVLLTGCSSADDEPNGDAAPSPTVSQSPHTASPDPGDADASPDPGDADGRTLAPEEVPTEVVEKTEKATDDFFDSVGGELEEPDAKKKLETLPGVTGAALEELRNQVTEYDASGWRVLGEPVVVRQRVVRLLEDPERAVVHACIDNSKVRVVDADGKQVPNSKPAQPRTRNILTLVKKKDSWVVTERRPAAKPNC